MLVLVELWRCLLFATTWLSGDLPVVFVLGVPYFVWVEVNRG